MTRNTAKLRLVHNSDQTPTDESVDFDALFIRFSPYVAQVAFRILGHTDEVDDVVQDVFIEAHKGIALLKSARHAKGWLATITVRICVRRLRVKKLYRFLVPGVSRTGDVAEFDIPQNGLSPEEQVWIKNVYAVLETMPVALRVAWVLRHMQEERLEHVARLCGCSLATAKRRIAKAHQMIREVVDNDPV